MFELVYPITPYALMSRTNCKQRAENGASNVVKNDQYASIAPNLSGIAKAITNVSSSSTPLARPTLLDMPLAPLDPYHLLHP
jgi:hypothetical protein